MKKGGIIAAIIFISIFISIYVGIELIKGGLPEPEFGDLYDFEFDRLRSTKNETHIIAKMNITNPDQNNLTINISYENLRCDVYYDNLNIGSINLSTLKKDTEGFVSASGRREFEKSFKRIFSKVEGGNETTFLVFFNLSNEALSEVFYNHTMKNDERGKISFKLNFTIEIILPLGLTIPFDKNILIEIEKDIATDILEKLDWMKYNKNLNETPLLNYPLINSTFIYMFKKSESNIIQFNYITRFLGNKNPFMDLYIGDDFYWITRTEPLDIRIGLEMIFYGKPCKIFALNKWLPLGCKVYVNDIPFGHCNIQSVERDYGRSKSQRIEASVYIDGSRFGEWMYSHINNNETTVVNITIYNEKLVSFIMKYPSDIHRLLPSYGENYTLFVFNMTLSELIDKIELPDMSFDLSSIQRDLFFYQLLTMVLIINTIIVVIVLYFAFWKRGKYLVFK